MLVKTQISLLKYESDRIRRQNLTGTSHSCTKLEAMENLHWDLSSVSQLLYHIDLQGFPFVLWSSLAGLIYSVDNIYLIPVHLIM